MSEYRDARQLVVLGGDRRSSCLAACAAADGFEVRAVGFERQPEVLAVPMAGPTALTACDILVLPLPTSLDMHTVNTPFADMAYPLETVFSALPPDALVFVGKPDDAVRAAAHRHGARMFDYYEREELMLRNAVPTAEGALMLAMEQTDITVRGSRTLVLGFGRIARAVSALFRAVGARVTVAARRFEDFAEIEVNGCDALDIRHMEGRLAGFDIVVNTVPAHILPAPLLAELPKSCFVLDLASRPGGVDFDAARQLELRAIWALSLPGRVAPVTAGKAIWSTIKNMLAEEELL